MERLEIELLERSERLILEQSRYDMFTDKWNELEFRKDELYKTLTLIRKYEKSKV